MASQALLFSIISCLFFIAKGDFVIQSDKQCGSYFKPVEERVLDLDEFDVFSHSGRQYYAPGMDCILTIIGKTYNQWEITVTQLNIDKYKDTCREQRAPCCNDFLKIFNSYRVDNARLFPSIPWRGLCGTELPRQSTYTSTQNYITIQFNANPVDDYMTGFVLHLRQYPRRSSGSDFSQTGYIGGWNDGSLLELQIDWSNQEQVPGDYKPGQDPTFEYDPKGIACYECIGCKRDYFRTSDIGVALRSGCYVCTKEWLQGNAQATRQCLSKNTYLEKLRTLMDTSGGNSVSDFRGCKTFLRGVQGSTYISVCICDTGKCNKGLTLKSNPLTLMMLPLVALFIAVKYFS
ncbi:hypothetical protein Bpfe_017073 [Biomphalaria pfeifferi]|uniref:CUB domain-containing protein n=1 Tax=Biomphalaria pfeifferi TaxID=112525 RepID=A0AAD8F7L5_BIOPF|nr:hypothetical protein Bpfe_017073 [Biomphalaria pfeifferi]